MGAERGGSGGALDSSRRLGHRLNFDGLECCDHLSWFRIGPTIFSSSLGGRSMLRPGERGMQACAGEVFTSGGQLGRYGTTSARRPSCACASSVRAGARPCGRRCASWHATRRRSGRAPPAASRRRLSAPSVAMRARSPATNTATNTARARLRRAGLPDAGGRFSAPGGLRLHRSAVNPGSGCRLVRDLPTLRLNRGRRFAAPRTLSRGAAIRRCSIRLARGMHG